MARSSRAKAAVVEEDEDYDVVEDVSKKAKKSGKAVPPREKIEYGAAWLAGHISDETGNKVDPARVRILLRKLTKDGTLKRTEAEARSRYNFTKGANDPEVKAIMKAVKGGALEKAQSERLEGLKATRKASKAAPAEEPKGKKGKAVAAPAPKARPSRSKKAAADDDLDIDDI